MESSTRAAQAYERLRDMIRRRELRGDQNIVESRIAETLALSRTPLREALQRLEGEGLVVKSANFSFKVRKVDLAEYLNSLNVRIILEVEAIGLAVHRIRPAEIELLRQEINELKCAPEFDREAHWRSDNNIHATIADASGNPVLSQMIQSLRITTNLFEIDRVADRVEPDSTEHMTLLDALAAGDAAKAKRAMRRHIVSLKAHATRGMV